uniref:Uncharacterized protein n=2 Tax=Strongyloides stercoralis TaxID=6248 RepID=A0AAF5DLF1_STRER
MYKEDKEKSFEKFVNKYNLTPYICELSPKAYVKSERYNLGKFYKNNPAIMNNIIASENVNSQEPPKHAFGFIPPRHSGIWSFFLQIIILLISTANITFLYVFLNGQPIATNGSHILKGKTWNFNIINEVEQILNKSNNVSEDPFFHHKLLNNDTTKVLYELSDAVINIGSSVQIEIAKLCNCRRSGNANVTSGEYVLPVATVSSNLPYIDEQSIRNFSNF